MKTITFYSYKGGVGRTLLLANLAKRLAEVGKTVCILDFDLEAPSSSSKFGFAKFGTDAKTGLVDYIYDFQENKKLPEIIETTELFTTYADKFFLIKAGDSSTPDYWKKLLKISWNKLFYEQDSQGIEFLLYFKDLIKTQINPDYLLIDTRTGITEIASVTISLFADEVVMLSGNNKDSLDGSKQVLKTITNKENIYNDNIPNIYFILSRLPEPLGINKKEEEARIINQCLNDINSSLKENNYELNESYLKVIHSDRQLELKEELKIGYGLENEKIIATDYYDIFNLIFRNSLSSKELDDFYNIKKSEALVKKALVKKRNYRVEGFNESIKLLEDAIKINKENKEAYFNLAQIYRWESKYDKAKECLNKISEERHDNYLNVLYESAFLFENLKEFNSSLQMFYKIKQLTDTKTLNNNYLDIELFILRNEHRIHPNIDLTIRYENLVKKHSDTPHYYNGYANYLMIMGKYEKAIEQLYKAFEIYSEYGLGYSTLAEIYSIQNKDAEFYQNFEFALKFKLTPIAIFQHDTIDIYKKHFTQDRFIKLLEKYEYKYAIKRIKKYLGQEVDEDDF